MISDAQYCIKFGAAIMYLEIILGVIVTIVFYLRVKWVTIRDYWTKRGVPHHPPHPIMGSLTFLQKQNPTHWMRKLYRDFDKTPYVGIWLFWRPGLVVNCPEIARRILVKDSDNFRNRFLSSGSKDPFGALNLLTVNDPLWTSIRRRLSSIFTAAKLRPLQGIIHTKVEDLIDRIRHDSQKGLVDLRRVFTDFTTDVTGEAAFGVTSESTKNKESAMRKATLDMMQYSAYRGICWSSIFFFPTLVDIFGFTFYPKQTTEFLRACFRTMVAQRGGYDREVTECRDFLDAVLKMKQTAAAEGQEMSEDLVLAQAAILLFGGFDTSANTLTWLTYELAHHPECQEKLYHELLDAKQKIDGKYFENSLLAELPYFNAVIKEILRKFPPMSWLDRVATNNYKLNDKLTIAAGTPVYVNGTAMHMDPDYFPDPNTFDPARFLPENEQNIKPYTYLPFGDGPRICIGQRFAYQTMRLCLAPLLLTYRLSPAPGFPLPNDCRVETKGMFFAPGEKLCVLFTPRE